MRGCFQSWGFNVCGIKFESFLLQFVIRCPSPIGCFSALHLLVFVFTFVGCVERHLRNCFGLWRRGSNALFPRSSLLQQLICHVEAGPEGARSDMQLFEARHTSHGALLVCGCAALMELFLFSLGLCECVRVSTRVISERSVIDGIFLMAVGQLESRFTWLSSVGFERGFLEGFRANAGLRFISVACYFLSLDNERASGPLLIHAVVFVLTLFPSCSGGFLGPLCRSCLKPHGLCSQFVVICRLRVYSCEQRAW